MRRTVQLLIVVIAVVSSHAADHPVFDYRLVLSVRHPEVFTHPEFQKWDRTHTLARWAEELPTLDGNQVVWVQEAGPVTSAAGVAFQLGFTPSPKVIDFRPFSGEAFLQSFEDAAARLPKGGTISSAVPTVDLSQDQPIRWQITLAGAPPQTYEIRDAAVVVEAMQDEIVPHDCAAGGDDSGNSNDLHHPTDRLFADTAASVVRGITDPAAQIGKLTHYVHGNYRYKLLDSVNDYTDSDKWTFRRKWGACDELAVILITYLRALNIHARMKFLLWVHGPQGTPPAVHAVVECMAGGTVHYLDPTFDYVDQPDRYRQLSVDGFPVTQIKVVDVDWPDDARSNTPVGPLNLPDTDSTDGRLNPWGDFCYSPSQDGEVRAPYSR